MEKKDTKKVVLRIVFSLIALLVPTAMCLTYLWVMGRSFNDVSLLMSEWDDELIYFKQVEGVLNGGIPGGYFGYNESHAALLSFGAWSPVLLIPWVLWGLVFGWNLMSPFICNLVIYSLCFALFIFLTAPGIKKFLCTVLLFSLFLLNIRYIFSAMPEIIVWSLLLVFYGLFINTLRDNKKYKTAFLYAIAVVLTLIRPFFLLLYFVPMIMSIRKSSKKWFSWTLNGAGLLVLLAAYAFIKKSLSAEYFASLYNTSWLTGGIKNLFVSFGNTLYDLMYRILKSFNEVHADGTFFVLFILVAFLLFLLILGDTAHYVKARKETGEEREAKLIEAGNRLFVECHYFIMMLAVFVAILLMYTLTQGSKHLLAFIIVGLMLLTELGRFEEVRTVLLGAACVYMFWMKWNSYEYDYVVPFKDQYTDAREVYWRDAFAANMEYVKAGAPSYDNTIIWVLSDQSITTPPANIRGRDMFPLYTDWQMLYLIPKGFAINCCKGDYVTDNFDSLKCRYLAVIEGGDIDRMCKKSDTWTEFGREGSLVVYKNETGG